MMRALGAVLQRAACCLAVGGFVRALPLALAFVVFDSSASADGLTLSEAINKAGRQRMLTQRIVKTYCLVGLDVDARRARAELYEAIELFEAQFAELRVFSGEARVTAALDRVASLWLDFDALASGPVDREGARRLMALDEQMLAAADAVVLELEALSQRPYARLVNISGRQRMLSQRMVKFHLFQAWGLGSAAVLDQIDRARNEFQGALMELRASPENTPAIDRELAAAAEQWQWLKSALSLYQADTYFPSIVDDAAEKTLAIMERATDLYARLYRQRVADARGNN
jgi:nitrate/nitrite-specific signal transduction histidine kinase